MGQSRRSPRRGVPRLGGLEEPRGCLGDAAPFGRGRRPRRYVDLGLPPAGSGVEERLPDDASRARRPRAGRGGVRPDPGRPCVLAKPDMSGSRPRRPRTRAAPHRGCGLRGPASGGAFRTAVRNGRAARRRLQPAPRPGDAARARGPRLCWSSCVTRDFALRFSQWSRPVTARQDRAVRS